MNIRCLTFREMNKGSLVGFCDLQITGIGLTIKDCKLMDGSNGPWVALPSTSYQTRDGKTQYRNLVEFSEKDIRDEFNRDALAAITVLRHPQPRSNLHRFERRQSQA